MNNRADKGSASSGHVMRFKQLSVDGEYTLQTIRYTYDSASRVLDADYYPGGNTASTPTQTFAYEYDVAGNLTDNNGTARTFNKLNQISSGAVTYDVNGNMTNDGTNAYTWDRANRPLSMSGHDYAYDGVGNRVAQTVSSIVTRYLLDMQPGLVQVIAATVDSDIESYVHSPRGIHMTQDAAEDWHETLQDGLGSIRGEIDANLNVGGSGAYQPYGVPMGIEGTYSQPFRFTGEMLDDNMMQYHRARYYAAVLANWASVDLFEGSPDQPGSLNMYSWVEGNAINLIDPSGYCVGCGTEFHVNVADALEPQERNIVMEAFKNRHWRMFGDVWDVLGREIEFVIWMQRSERLTPKRKDNWWDVADSYLTASRLAGETFVEFLRSNTNCQGPYLGYVDPGIREWATFIIVADGFSQQLSQFPPWLSYILPGVVAGLSSGLNPLFWRAHNTALREGVRRANALGLRSQLPIEERQFTDIVLYDVFEPGDQCANGRQEFCAFTFPAALSIGAWTIYPQQYPATQQDLDRIDDAFKEIWILWLALGANWPSEDIHLIVKGFG